MVTSPGATGNELDFLRPYLNYHTVNEPDNVQSKTVWNFSGKHNFTDSLAANFSYTYNF